MPGGQHRGRARPQVGPFQQDAFPQIGVTVQEHPAIRRYAQAPGRAGRQIDRAAAAVTWLVEPLGDLAHPHEHRRGIR